MKNNYKTFVIHYKALVERKNVMVKALEVSNLRHEFISNYDRGNLTKEIKDRFTSELPLHYVANFMSHIESFRLIVEQGHALGLILEDDSVPSAEFIQKSNRYLKKLPDDFDLFYISPGKGNFHMPFYKRRPFKFIYKKESNQTKWGGHGGSRYADAYFVSNKCAKLMYKEFEDAAEISLTIDWWKNNIIKKHNLNVYWAEPTIIDTNIYETSF
jgi:GR25 family glycosyltransferase involved in LPS biosynthesis